MERNERRERRSDVRDDSKTTSTPWQRGTRVPMHASTDVSHDVQRSRRRTCLRVRLDRRGGDKRAVIPELTDDSFESDEPCDSICEADADAAFLVRRCR